MVLALLSSSGAPGSRGQASVSLFIAQCLPSKTCVEAQVSEAASAVTTVRRMVALAPVCQEATSVGGGSAGSNKLPSADIGITVSAPMINAATRKRPPTTGVGSSSSTTRRLTAGFLAGAASFAAPLTSGLLESLVAIARFNSANCRRSQVLPQGSAKPREKPGKGSFAVGKSLPKKGLPEQLVTPSAEMKAVV